MKRNHALIHASSLRRLGVALLAVAGTAMGQTAAPVGVAKPAAYDCSGLEGVALTSCRQLNAAQGQGALITPDTLRSTTHDCAGMIGAALATCRDLNGQQASSGGGGYGSAVIGNGTGYGASASGMTAPNGSTGVQAAPGTTPITQQTTGGTNSITPSGTGAAGTTGGSNPIVPSGTGVPPAAATIGDTMPQTGSTNPITNQQVPTTAGSVLAPGTPLSNNGPSNGQVPPPSDRIVPATGSAPTRSGAAAPLGGAAGAKVGK